MSSIQKLSITNLRNLSSISIELSPQLNLFYGVNGSGKTSVLEAVSLLGLGRSFRTHKPRHLIQNDQEQLTVFAQMEDQPIGVQKQRTGKGQIKIGGETVLSASTLAKTLPLQMINSESFLFIEGPPAQRRQFLDWMVFHVKPEFAGLWRDIQKVLKQRNSTLRHDKISYLDIKPWDLEFCRLAEIIHQLRVEVFESFLSVFKETSGSFSVDHQVDLHYVPGWNQQQSLAELLQEQFERDSRDGYTHIGPHRADIKCKVGDRSASEIMSRGQEKTLICALHIAQARLFQQKTSKQCVFLVDDLLSELDKNHSQTLAKWLLELGSQILVTGVDKASLLDIWPDNKGFNVFHVEHGTISLD